MVGANVDVKIIADCPLEELQFRVRDYQARFKMLGRRLLLTDDSMDSSEWDVPGKDGT
jgi:hypothetical protein